MYRSAARLSLCLFWLYLPLQVSMAQSEDTFYIKMDYMSLSDSNPLDYLEVELGLWKRIHEERIRQGVTTGWYLFSVVPGQKDVPYDYITISVFDDIEKVHDYKFNEIIELAYPGIDINAMLQQTDTAREFIYSDVWQVNGMILPSYQDIPSGEYITVNYFDSNGASGEHLDLEFGFWTGIHEKRIEREALNSVGIFTLMNPEGQSRGYDYSTIDFYDTLSQLKEPVGMELAKVTYPELNESEIRDYFERTSAARSSYQTVLWRLVDSLGSSGY